MTTLLSQVPLGATDRISLAPPMFHGFGLSRLALGLALGATVVLRRRFDADPALADAARHRVHAVVGVPVMLQRLLAAHERARPRPDLPQLRAVIWSGAPLTPLLSRSLTAAFGDVVFNLYGSSETGFGAMATPANLRAVPGTAGRPPLGAHLAILDDAGAEVAAGVTGRIFVGSSTAFDGYTGGGTKANVRGVMATGDVGCVDSAGRLFVEGRADDMIVSGGQNVFPQEVEDVLAAHPDVDDVVVVGVPDAEFRSAVACVRCDRALRRRVD